MTDKSSTPQAGEELVKHELITREDLDEAKARAEQSGAAWYQPLLQTRKVSFQAISDILNYEMHLTPGLRKEHASLGDTLVKMGVLSQDALKRALAEQRRTGRLLGKILVEQQFVSVDDCAKGFARQYELEYAALASTPSTVAALETVPESMATKHGMLPVEVAGDRITVLITDPQVRDRLHQAGCCWESACILS